MKKALTPLFLIAIMIASAASLNGQSTIKDTRNIDGFTKVSFGIAGDLEIKTGNRFSVVLEGESRDLEEIETELSGSKLLIKLDSWNFRMNDRVKVYISMPSIEGLSVSGSGNARIISKAEGEDLSLNVSGSGKINTAELAFTNLDCSISGSGSVNLGGGEVKDADVSISGSGNLNSTATKIETMDFGVSGSGSGNCFVTGSLDASISGSGSITYSGTPSVDARISGSGHVRKAK